MSILRTGVHQTWPFVHGPHGPSEDTETRTDTRADEALALLRREATADAMKRAAHSSYFLGGGRYL